MKHLVIIFTFIALAGCVTSSKVLDTTNSAELAFAKNGSPRGVPGSFDSIDGKSISGRPTNIQVPAGKHTIGYSCPDVLSVDTQTSVKAKFTAGKNYLLQCDANKPGVIIER